MSAGRVLPIAANSAFTSSVTLTVFASGWRKMFSKTARLPSAVTIVKFGSTPISTEATSATVTGTLLIVPTTIPFKSSAVVAKPLTNASSN